MASLYARKDDAQALKPFIAACIAGKQLLFTSVTDASSARSKASNPFGTSTVAYLTPDGIQLTEANAISKLLGETQRQEEDWKPHRLMHHVAWHPCRWLGLVPGAACCGRGRLGGVGGMQAPTCVALPGRAAAGCTETP